MTDETKKAPATAAAKPATLVFKAKNVKMEKDKSGEDIYTVTVTDNIDFLTDSVVKDPLFEEFITDLDTRKYISQHIVKLEAFLETFPKDKIMDGVTWEWMKDYYKDHVDIHEILDFIGWEKVCDHFKDKLDQMIQAKIKKALKKNINTVDSDAGGGAAPAKKTKKSLLEMTEEDGSKEQAQ